MDYDLEKLSREIVTSRLKGIERAPRTAAEIAKKILIAAVVGAPRQEPRLTVTAVCRGVMGGLLLIEKDLPEAAVLILRELSPIAHETHLDPAELMTWGMEGIAQVAALAAPEVQWRIQERIEESYLGAGPVFRELCGRFSRAGDK